MSDYNSPNTFLGNNESLLNHAEAGPALKRLYGWFRWQRRRQTRTTILLDSFCRHLVEQGIPVDRVSLHIPQLHPQLRARSLIWDKEFGGAQEIGRQHGIENRDEFIKSPIYPILEEGLDYFWCKIDQAARDKYALLNEFAQRGFTEYHAVALEFSSGQANALTLATKNPEGFSDYDSLVMQLALPLLGAAVELRHLRATAAQLLNTYVGPLTGEKILDGDIHRGEGEIINAVLWTCDLRNFTALSEAASLNQVIQGLDDYFEAVGRPIANRRGEILKFIGDAILAIFPLSPGANPQVAQEKAVAAALEAVSRLDALNRDRRDRGEEPLRCGIALHIGDVMYGNIGTADRLDFTVIGPAVNLVSRIESHARDLNPPVVCSQAFADRLPDEMRQSLRSLGRHALKGIAEAQEIYQVQEGSA